MAGMRGRGVHGARALLCAAIAVAVATVFRSASGHPLAPRDNESPDAAPPFEFGALAPALIAALFLITVVLLLGGCVCCRRNKFKQFTNGVTNDLPELVGTSSVQISGTSSVPIDTGIVNPIADREFTIFGPLAPDGIPRPHGSNATSPDLPRIVHQFYDPVDAANNNPQFENNNGPISPQELENIVNNNAENYIVSEYENRNINENIHDNNVITEEPQVVREIASAYQEPLNDDFNNSRVGYDSHRHWFENREVEITRNQLKYLCEIGRGWFGRIIEAEIINVKSDDTLTVNANDIQKISKVAVKTLDENISFSRKCNFLDECELYKNASHENIIKLIGVNLSQDPWLILFEYCSQGDMKNFLKSNKSNSLSLASQGIPIKFQCEIASAISYLHSINVVLPYIACHCCLITEEFSAKLGDYGGSENLYPTDFYKISENNSIPLRWLAPECVQKMGTKAGNVWSLGIFLWESCSWGTLPYETLTNEQVITDVLCQNGARLQQPQNIPGYFSYIFQIMQLCWQYTPLDRISSDQVLSLLQCIYYNHFDSSEQKTVTQRTSDDFDARWQSFKPNTIPKIDNGHPASNIEPLSIFKSDLPTPEYLFNEVDKCPKFDTTSVSTVELDVSTEIILDNFSEKTKSDSLTNLHGSLESVNEKSPMDLDQNSQCMLSDDASPSGKTSDGILTFNSYIAHCEVAPWLQDLPVNSQEDMSYIKTVSDVISDLDNMLSSEKTSSSESSHQTSPLRDVFKNTILCDNNCMCPTYDEVLECSNRLEKDVNSEITNLSNKSVSTGSASKSTSVSHDNLTQNVPEMNSTKSTTRTDMYPTLDFRLAKIDNTYDTKCEVYPIFQTKFANDGQDYDSLQDSSYIPSASLNVGDLNERDILENNLGRQCSSGSETEDEIWKKRIEIGALSEKIKLKSKSATDFMVLTHIDMDFTDLESEDASYTSVDGRYSALPSEVLKKRFIYDNSQKDSSLPTVEYLSNPKYFSSSSAYQNDIISRPSIDFKKLKKNIFDSLQRNLRPTKSSDDITSLSTKSCSKDSLIFFKKNMDRFLCVSNSIQNGKSETRIHSDKANITSESNASKINSNDTWDSTKYLDIDNLTISFPQNMDTEDKKPKTDDLCNDLKIKHEDSMGVDSITLKNVTESIFSDNLDDLKGAKRSALSNIERNSALVKPIIDGDYKVKKLEQTFVCDDVIKEKACYQNKSENPNSSVVMGPFFDCTLDLYTGIKTDFKNGEEIPEEEALMFSSNFNDFHVDIPQNTTNSCINDVQGDAVTSSYFFTRPSAIPSDTKCDKPIDFSIDTWDRFLGSSFEDNSQNFDSIFPDINEKSLPVNSTDRETQSKDLQSVEQLDNGSSTLADENGDNVDESICNQNTSIDISNLASSSRFIGVVFETDLNSLTSKLAIAENENNLNIENSNPLLSEDLHDDSTINEAIVDDDVVQNENDMSSTDVIENVDDGWFLHNATRKSEIACAGPSTEMPNMYTEFGSNEALESLDDNSDSTLEQRVIDPESVQALRNELELKLPLAHKMAQVLQENKIVEKDHTENNETPTVPQSEDQNVGEAASSNREHFNPKHQRSSEYNCGKNIFNDQDASKTPDSQIPRNEVLIHYNMYGAIPLSPIQEESWSEFSDLVKAGEFEKSDTSNSLSLGQLNSIVVNELPLDKESGAENEHNHHKTWSDDETNDDSHGSNRTFVALDGFESSQPEKIKSISIDSLNCIDDQIDMDEEPVQQINRPSEINIQENPVTDLLSPFYEDHSTTKSTEEISQNVDNLLENISKTLENASKVGSVSSDHIVYPNVDIEVADISENGSIVSEKTDSGSRTYVIEGKKNIDDLTYTCPNKVINVPEDISNVSKISQPSFVSDISSLASESQLKPSEKSSQIFHSKTASIDSWCSNDTLFNVEENFDDNCLNDFMENVNDKFIDAERRSITPTNIDNGRFSREISTPERRSDLYCFRQTISMDDNFIQPQVEMVMNYPSNTTMNDNIDFRPLNSSIVDSTGAQNYLISPTKLASPKMLSVTNTENSLCLIPNSSESNVTSFSDKSSADNISVIQNEASTSSLPKIKNDDPISSEKESNELKSPKFTTGEISSDVFVTSTPVEIQNAYCVPNTEEECAIDSAEALIHRQFEFLDNIDNSISNIEEDKEKQIQTDSTEDQLNACNIECDFSGKSTILNFVNIDQDVENYKNICNITDKFIEMEKNVSHDDLSNIKNQSDINSLNELSYIQHVNRKIDDISENFNGKFISNDVAQPNSNNSDFALSTTSYDEFLHSIEDKHQDVTNFEISNHNQNDIVYQNGKNSSNSYYDGYDSSLAEYVAHSGLDIGVIDNIIQNENTPDALSNHSISKDNIDTQDSSNKLSLLNNSLSYIHFSGPIIESTSSEEYFRTHLNSADDINNIAPECLKDWDSGSEESNGNSSSSGEFTWRKGDAEESVNLSASFCTQSNNNKQKKSDVIPMNQEYVTIPEEVLSQSGDSADGSGDEEEVEFIPSSWDYLAMPSKSALKSPDSSQSESRKKVAFKKQKYQCVYEYPREIIEYEMESPHLVGSSTYADWQTYCNESDSQYDKFIECPNDYNPTSHASSDMPMPVDDFYITSSTAPFESYSFLNSSSQFFPGHHLSLLNDVKPYDPEYDELDDNMPLPLPPVPQELIEFTSEDYSDDVNNMISNILSSSKSNDFITPDSGTEDVTPGSLLDEFEFQDKSIDSKPSDALIQCDEVDSSTIQSKLSSHELSLNLTNKLKSSNCNSLTLIDRGSPSGSLTPSTPSPSAVVNSNHSSGSSSPLHANTSVLGGLRHTRDKLKLDLPPSPLSRNSPNSLNSTKNSSGDIKIFDFKVEPENKKYAEELRTSNIETESNSVSNHPINKNNCAENDCEKVLDSDVAKVSNDNLKIVLEKIKTCESVESDSPLSPLDKNNTLNRQQDFNDHEKQTSSVESIPSDHVTLQKAVAPINADENVKKSHLEPVKGEGTLLDSGDEDSGIGSSAYTTLERKIEHVHVESHLVGESR